MTSSATEAEASVWWSLHLEGLQRDFASLQSAHMLVRDRATASILQNPALLQNLRQAQALFQNRLRDATFWGERVALLRIATEVLHGEGCSHEVLRLGLEDAAAWMTVYLRDPELRVRRALSGFVEEAYRDRGRHQSQSQSSAAGESDSQAPAAESTCSSSASCTTGRAIISSASKAAFLRAVLADVLVGFQRKKRPVLPTMLQSKEKDAKDRKDARAALAPGYLKNSNANAGFVVNFGKGTSGMNEEEDELVAEAVPEAENLIRQIETTEILPPKNPHESEGWGTLESSMSCLAAMFRGAGATLGDDIVLRDVGGEVVDVGKTDDRLVEVGSSSLGLNRIQVAAPEEVRPGEQHTCAMVIRQVACMRDGDPQKLLRDDAGLRQEIADCLARNTASGGTSAPDNASVPGPGVEKGKAEQSGEKEEGGYNDLVRQGGWATKPDSDVVLQLVVDETPPRILSFLVGKTPARPLPFSIEYFLLQCAEHPNRFVREYAFLCLADLLPLLFGKTVESLSLSQAICYGLQDNWSQVKYAASKAVRALISHPEFSKSSRSPTQTHLLRIFAPYMCLNRHYVAEGVRLYSLENWKLLNPQGGIPLILNILDEIVEAYCDSTNAPNHAVREAACKCILELAERVCPASEESRKAFLEPFSCSLSRSRSAEDEKLSRLDMLVAATLSALEDESWPVRDHATMAAAKLAVAFPAEFEKRDTMLVFDDEEAGERRVETTRRNRLLQLLLFNIGDNIPCLRKNAAKALAVVLKLFNIVAETFVEKLDAFLKEGENQPMDSKNFAAYTPSGPFSVPSRKQEYKLSGDGAMQAMEKDPRFDDATMYSCGSVAPRNFKKFKDKGGCMNCTVHGVLQPWERAEGAFHTLVELRLLLPNTSEDATSGSSGGEGRVMMSSAFFEERMKVVLHLFTLTHFPHHCQLKQTVVERLGHVTAFYRPEKKFLQEYIVPASEQKEHKALAFAARGYLKRLEGAGAMGE